MSDAHFESWRLSEGAAMEWTAVLVCVGVFLVFNAAAVCVFWAACVVLDQAENEFDESEGEGRG